MEFRASEYDPATSMTLDEFCALVRGGRVRPDALYREPWTNGQWLTVDNLRPFHRNSPATFPRGRKLVEAEEARALADRVREQYTNFDAVPLLEQMYDLRPLEQLTAAPGVCGAARLFVCPSFENDVVLTVTFNERHLQVQAATGLSAWSTLYTGFHPAEVRRGEANVHYRKAPPMFFPWTDFSDGLAQLPDCRTDTLDGVGYHHQLLRDGEMTEVEWSNPRKGQHDPQLAVVDGYGRLARAAWLSKFVKGLR